MNEKEEKEVIKMNGIKEWKVGKNRDITLRVEVEEYQDDGYIAKKIVLNFVERCIQRTLADYVSEYDNKRCVLYVDVRKNEYFVLFYVDKAKIKVLINKEIYDTLDVLYNKIYEENRQKFFENVKLYFEAQKTEYLAADESFFETFLVENRELNKDEQKRFNKIYNALKKNKDIKIQMLASTLNRISADKRFELGKKYTLEEVEKAFEKELKEYDEYLKQKEEEKRKKEEEYEQKKQQAIEEAKKIGKEVIIRKVGVYEKNEKDEEGLVIVYEVATQNGKVVEQHRPTY